MTDEEEKAQQEKEQAEREAAEKAAAEKAKEDAGKPASSPAEGEQKTSPLEEARALDKSIKEGTEKMQKLLEKNEKLMADAAITGKGFAGQPAPAKKTDDEKWAEEAKLRYAGTGMDPTTPVKDEVTYS